MTCILTLKTDSHIIMASDGQSTLDNLIVNRDRTKIFQNNFFCIGMSGTYSYIEIFKSVLSYDSLEENMKGDAIIFCLTNLFHEYTNSRHHFERTGGAASALIIAGSSVYWMEIVGNKIKTTCELKEKFSTIGSGGMLAIGAYDALISQGRAEDRIVDLILKSVIHEDIYCSGETQIISIPLP